MIFVGLAAAADAEAWAAWLDARLVEAADGAPEVAVRFYEEILGELGPDDPLRPAVACSLGRARLVTGNVDGAVAALKLAVGDPAVGPAAGVLLTLIEQERRQLQALPVVIDFRTDSGPFVRGWQGRTEGELGVAPVEGNPALAWPTLVSGGDTDELIVGIGPEARAREVRFRVRADSFPAVLRLAASDGAGGRWYGPTLTVPTDRWVEVQADIRDFRPARGAAGGAPGAVRSVLIEELTGVVSSDRGASTLWIDDVELR